MWENELELFGCKQFFRFKRLLRQTDSESNEFYLYKLEERN